MAASPASTSRSSFFEARESPLSPSRDGRPRLTEQLSYGGFSTDEESAFKPARLPSECSKPLWRNRFLKPFLPHPNNPTIFQRTYGLFHGHSFYVPNAVARRRTMGWKIGLRWATIGTFAVFVANTIFLIIIIAVSGNDNGIGTLYSGDCNVVSNYDTWIHVLINVLSTILLGASSYVMQCLNSPSRAQVDQAHAQGKTMDIGMPSFKNARRVGWRQTGLWLMLGISAMPLHIFWNSAIFSTLEANQYDMYVVPNDFVSTANFSCDLVAGCDNAESLYKKSRAGELDYLTAAECITTYSTNFLAGRRNALLVTSNVTRGWTEVNASISDAGNASVFGIIMSRRYDIALTDDGWNPNSWWCIDASVMIDDGANSTGYETSWYSKVKVEVDFGASCSQPLAIANAGSLQVVVGNYQTREGYVTQSYSTNTSTYDSRSYLYNVDHCWSERVPEVCQLQSANYVWVIVIFCNAIKLCCMFLTARALRSAGEPLVVIGDAVASFLERPDKYSEGNCLMSTRTAGKPKPIDGRVWKHKQPLWLKSSSKWSWIKTLSLCTSILILLIIVFSATGVWSPHSSSDSWTSLSFGAVSPSAVIGISSFGNNPASFSTLMAILLFVNCPQILFSSLYFMYNSLLTSMLAMQEFSRFSSRRRTLRVSSPLGAQRYTYWLQLPYKYSFPLLAASGLMHWFISQSLFLARVQVIDEYGNAMKPFSDQETVPYLRNGTVFYESVPNSNNAALFTLPGYSPKAVICSLCLGATMVLVIFGLSFRRHPGGVPFIGNNSLAISASCHPREGEESELWLKGVMWGATSHEKIDEDGGGMVPGHCSFSAGEVEAPLVGGRYA